jgi:hypothetical protein
LGTKHVLVRLSIDVREMDSNTEPILEGEGELGEKQGEVRRRPLPNST